MDYSKIIDIASKVSLAVVLMVILVGGVQGYWVAGTTYQEMKADRDEWKKLALRGTNLAAAASSRGPIIGLPPTYDSRPPAPTLQSDADREQVSKTLDLIAQRTRPKGFSYDPGTTH